MYPEHDKLDLVKEKSQAIGEFLAWAIDERRPPIIICEPADPHEGFDEPYIPLGKSIPNLLAEYFKIDPEKLDQEKEEMLAELRYAQTGILSKPKTA